MTYPDLVDRVHRSESIYERYVRTIGLEVFSEAEEALADFLFRKYGMPLFLLSLDEVHRSCEQFKRSDRGRELF
jgi:hypothetical protein